MTNKVESGHADHRRAGACLRAQSSWPAVACRAGGAARGHRRANGRGDGRKRRRRRDPDFGVHDVPLRRELCGRGAQPLSAPVRADQAGRSRQPIRRRCDRGLEAHARRRCGPHAAAARRLQRGPCRCGPQPRAQGSRASVDSGQPAHRRPPRPGHRTDPTQSRYADHCRSSWAGSAVRSAAAERTVGRIAEGADAGKTSERRHQDHRRLYAIA